MKSDDTRSLLQLRGQFIQAGRTQRQASLDTLKAALCAPDFLFFKPASQETGLLDASGLAERLSYFLTSGMPDASLLAAAAQDELLDAEQLQVHAQRLLASPEFERFVADFLDGWLNLRDLGSMPPDPQAFRQYYSSGLEPEMKRETQFLFQEAVRNNLPISKLLAQISRSSTEISLNSTASRSRFQRKLRNNFIRCLLQMQGAAGFLDMRLSLRFRPTALTPPRLREACMFWNGFWEFTSLHHQTTFQQLTRMFAGRERSEKFCKNTAKMSPACNVIESLTRPGLLLRVSTRSVVAAVSMIENNSTRLTHQAECRMALNSLMSLICVRS